MRTVWMLLTNDKYELPLVIADTVNELARIIGKRPLTIRGMVSRYERGIKKRCIYQRVRIPDDAEDE